MIKTCWICKHLSFYEGSEHYSELTPGSEATVSCRHKGAVLGFYDGDVKRDAIKLASKCKFYTPEDQSA